MTANGNPASGGDRGGARRRSFFQQRRFEIKSPRQRNQDRDDRARVNGARRRSLEAQIHNAIVEHLRLRSEPGVLWLHCPNGERRDKVTGTKLKRMGVLAGASDFLLWHGGNSFALELKARGGRLSEAQLDFLARFNDAGGHSACAEGLDRALACLSAWGLLRGRVQ